MVDPAVPTANPWNAPQTPAVAPTLLSVNYNNESPGTSCSVCTTPNLAGHPFCVECGRALRAASREPVSQPASKSSPSPNTSDSGDTELICGTCAAPNPRRYLFCGSCARSLRNTRPAAEPTPEVEADSDSLFYSHAYAKSREDGKSDFYARYYAHTYTDMVGSRPRSYAAAYAEGLSDRVVYLGRRGYGILDTGRPEVFAYAYADRIEEGYSRTYASAYAKQREVRQPEEFARAYAEQIEAGQSDGYCYTSTIFAGCVSSFCRLCSLSDC